MYSFQAFKQVLHSSFGSMCMNHYYIYRRRLETTLTHLKGTVLYDVIESLKSEAIKRHIHVRITITELLSSFLGSWTVRIAQIDD